MLMCVFSQASGRASISNAALASPTSPNVVDDRSNKANNRFSTAFGRFGGSSTAERSSSQPASAVQSPMEGPEAIVPTIVEQQSALPSSGPDAYIAPWTEEKVGGALDDKDLVNERFKRIGLLPSPAFGGSMASRESNENIKAAGENDDPISKVEGAVHPEETNVEQNSEAAKAITPIALPEPAATVEGITASDLPSEVPASVSDNAQPLAGTKEILPEHSVRVENTSNINRSPTRRPVPQQTVAEVQPSSRRSSVSSLHRDDNDVAESSIPLQRSVSPCVPSQPHNWLVPPSKSSLRTQRAETALDLELSAAAVFHHNNVLSRNQDSHLGNGRARAHLWLD
ncbi:unnamed protein product [Aureobasidium pullulans]|nr:unnamed protein product [Aureobasidium pullulans]